VTPRIVFVSREVYPFVGAGGLGASVMALARALSEVADVAIITTDLHERRFYELKASADPALPSGVKFFFVKEPAEKEVGSFYNIFHLWSARAYEALKEHYPDGGPDVVEFPDFLGEGAVTVQARKTHDPALRNTLVLIRNYTSHEMCDVLDGHIPKEARLRILYELERYALHHADHMVWPGGDILATYRRFFGDKLAPPIRIRHVVERERGSASVDQLPDLETLRLLYIGRLERRKGVQNLVRAATALEREDWQLTLLGGDTATGPLGVSMRQQLELMVADDPRITFHPRVPRPKMFDLIGQHHVAIYPSLWECWPFVALHAFECNRPVIATPTGGFVEMISPDNGWLTRDTSVSGLEATLNRVLDSREVVRHIVDTDRPRDALARLADTEEVREQYLELSKESRAKRPAHRTRSSEPLVSVIVPYFQMDAFVEETLESIFNQNYTRLEVIIVNDGSLREEDGILDELAGKFPITVLTQQNSGLGAARNLGISQARGRYVFPLDPDDLVLPSFVERCVDVLEHDSDLAFVTSWVRFIDERGRPHPPPVEGYEPFTNDTDTLSDLNVAGSAPMVIRRRVFDLGHWYSVDGAASYEDWLLYRRLARHGLYGHAIPERLILYRIRNDSMVREIAPTHHKRLLGEMEAHLREEEVEWVQSSG
jgi:glycosyltransferase involved in cell wall biosynthesis/GT2 family glycosyltransferase